MSQVPNSTVRTDYSMVTVALQFHSESQTCETKSSESVSSLTGDEVTTPRTCPHRATLKTQLTAVSKLHFWSLLLLSAILYFYVTTFQRDI